MKHPKRIYTIYTMTANGQTRHRFGSIAGVRNYLRHRAQYYRTPHHVTGWDASFFLDGITMEQAGFVEQGGYCREKTKS